VSSKKLRTVAVLATLAFCAAVPAAASAKVISISGSTSVFPLETKLAQAWHKTKKGKKFSFRILQGGSNVGISDVSKGRVSIGASSRDPVPGSDPGGLVFTKIARDAICMITNTANPVGNLTAAQIKGMFVGPTITSWDGIGPIGGTIDPIGRATTSGTHDAFKNIFLGGTNQGAFVAGKASNGLVQQSVKSDPHAVGYVSYAFTSGVHSVQYNGVDCTLRNAKSGAYGGVRSFYFVTQGAPVGGVAKFIKFAKSRKGQKIAASEWVPLH
jgi:phosphate transport system substrate-binding protein